MVQKMVCDRGRVQFLPLNSPLKEDGYRELDELSLDMTVLCDQRTVFNRKQLLKERLRDIEDAIQHNRCIVEQGLGINECVGCCRDQQGHGMISMRFEQAEIMRQLVIVQQLLEAIREFGKRQ